MSKTLLINTITAWDEPHRARHQLTHALTRRGYHAVFVARNEIGKCRIDIKKISDEVTLVVPYFPIDYRYRYRIPIINEWYQKWLYRRLSDIYPGVTVVNFDFTAHKIFRYFKSVIYYCNDEYIGNSKYPVWFVNKYHMLCENKVIKKTVFTVTTAPYLTKKLQRLNINTHEIMLGVNPVNLPPDYSGIRVKDGSKIRLGLMGYINIRHISLQLVNALAKDPAFELYLIGPVEDSFRKGISNTTNIVFTGILKGQDLTDVLMGVDVGLALYNLKRINPGTTPNKLWQYLSVGKPVIVSRIPNIREDIFPKDSVYLFDEHDSLNALIIDAHNQNSEEMARERIIFARGHTWDNRVVEFERLMDQYLR